MKVRIKFKKYGAVKFIGHLDVMRCFQKNFRRADIDVSYSQGFSPHQLMSFSAPLGVGITSDGEYLDLTVNSVTNRNDMMKRINDTSVDGIKVTDIVLLKDKAQNSMSIVKAADYVVSIRKDIGKSKEDIENLYESFMEKDEITVLKKTKKSEMEINIKPLIYEYAFEQKLSDSVIEEYDIGIKIFMCISTGSNDNLKPELVMKAFCEYCGIEYDEYAFAYHRNDIYSTNEPDVDAANIKKEMLIPLCEVDADYEQTDFYKEI